MSAGHHHTHRHSSWDESELDKLLNEPAVKEYLARPHQVDYSMKVPLTGGSNTTGRIYYIDSDVPRELRPFVLWHERVEKALRAVKDMSYARAHHLATLAEKRLIEHQKKDWGAYKAQISKPVRSNERRGREPLPKGFDLGPYRESGLMKKLVLSS